MRRILTTLLLSAWAIAESYGQDGRYVDDLYRGSTRKSRTAETQAASYDYNKARKQTQRSSQQLPVNWTPAQDARATAPVATSVVGTAAGELVTTYDDALQRRIEAYRNYKEMDDSYWQLMEDYHRMLSRKYDPDLYNIITFGNEMWAEPIYISALVDGSDPAVRVSNKQLYLPTTEKRTDVKITVNLSPDYWWWNNPWHYNGWYISWGSPSWRWSSYWRPSWGWNWTWGPSWSWGWGPAWHVGWGPGWGPAWGPGYRPPYWGGGMHGPYQPGRPVIWGGGHRPAYRPGSDYRPGSGSAAGRPTYSGGFRRNENGTGVAIDNGSGAVNRRPGNAIRPGSSGNQYTPPANTRPSVNAGTSGTTQSRPTVDRSYRRETTPAATQQQQRRETITRTETPRRSESSYSAPSRNSGSSGSFGGGSVVGGGRRR